MSCVVSIFRGVAAPSVAGTREGSFDDFARGLREPLPRTMAKTELPLWATAQFHGGARAEETVHAISTITLDVDEEPIPGAYELVHELTGFKAVIYSSSSATASSPRWRVSIALSRPVDSEEYRRIARTFISRLSFPVGSASGDPARQWYFPREGDDGHFEWLHIEGEPLDVDAALAASAEPEAATPEPTATRSPTTDTARVVAAMLGAAWPAKGRHAAQRALAGMLCRAGLPEADAIDLLCDVARIAGDEDRPKRTATTRHTYARAAEGRPYDGAPTLERHVPASVVHAARDLLSPYAERRARLASDLAAPEPTPANETTSPKKTETGGRLGFDYGGWEEEPPPVEYLVEHLVPRGCVGMIFGRADALKTWLLFSLGISVAKGEAWLGLYPTTRGKVGIVDYETGQHNMRRRLYMLRAGDCEGRLARKSLATLKPSQKEFWGALEKEGFDLVIIDSLRRSNPGADENDSGEAILPLELACEYSERTGGAVLFIHHAKKSSDDGWPEFRGSAGIEDQVDVSYAVRKTDVSAELKRVEVRNEKPGDMRKPDPFAAEVVFDDVARRATVRLSSARPDDAQGPLRVAISGLLARGPQPTKDGIARGIHRQAAEVRAEVDAMVAERVLVLLPGKGYTLDGPVARQERIQKAVEIPGLSTPAKLARAAHVDVDEVLELLSSGVLVRSGSGFVLIR